MEFTFEDFVDVIGHSNTSDPLEVLEAWEHFLAVRGDYESTMEALDNA